MSGEQISHASILSTYLPVVIGVLISVLLTVYPEQFHIPQDQRSTVNLFNVIPPLAGAVSGTSVFLFNYTVESGNIIMRTI